MTLVVFVASLLGIMALGTPIAFALLISGLTLMLVMDNFDTQILASNLIDGADNFALMAIPFFLFWQERL